MFSQEQVDYNLDLNRSICSERDGSRCRHCGTCKSLEIHHIDPYKISKNNHHSNLITLCDSCHRLAEESRLPDSDHTVGIVLAGGTGKRLSPLTLFYNKHELPIGSVPLIFHPVMTLRRLKVRQLIVILDRSCNKIPEMLGSGREFGLDIYYQVQDSPSGIADALLQCEQFVMSRKFYVILGDNVFHKNECFKPSLKVGTVFLKEVNNPMDYGVAEIKVDKIVSIEEKPIIPKSNLAVTGLYHYTGEVFNIIKSLNPSERDELEISHLNNVLCHKNELDFDIAKHPWYDVGCSHKGYIETQIAQLSQLYHEW